MNFKTIFTEEIQNQLNASDYKSRRKSLLVHYASFFSSILRKEKDAENEKCLNSKKIQVFYIKNCLN